MTETEWLQCTDPKPMLDFLRGEASDRKFRLFAVGCCRLLFDQVTDNRNREALETVEWYADGMVTEEDFADATTAAHAAAEATSNNAFWAIAHAANPDPRHYAEAYLEDKPAGSAQDKAEADILRDIVGNPFRRVTVRRAWLTPAVIRLAKTIYNDHAFHRLPELADHLEKAGCTTRDVLNHCRQPGEHVRGCWVVDLLLVKD